MITKFLRIACVAVLTALMFSGNFPSSAQGVKNKTPEVKHGTATGANKPTATAPAPTPGAKLTPAPTPAPAKPVTTGAPEPAKVDPNLVGKEGVTSDAPLMSENQRNSFYFAWIGGFLLITGSIIGFIVYKARPPKASPNLSLQQASDAYDGPKKDTSVEASPVEPANGQTAAETPSVVAETSTAATANGQRDAESLPAVAESVTSEPETEVKNTPATG